MSASNESGKLFGLLAEFETPGSLMHAAERVRDEGYRRWDVYTPFPLHGMDRAMGLRDSRLPWIVLGAGITGCAVAILMQWWTNAVDYPLLISGKPLFSLPANIPVAFELTILFSALATVVGVLMFTGLPRFYHPVFRNRRFKRASNDRFFLCIEASDPKFDADGTGQLLRTLGSSAVDRLEG
jgi:hypothetical protein